MSIELQEETIASLVLERAQGRPRVLFLDYDGTLVPFASRPELATPDAQLLDLLRQLTDRRDTEIHIVSGRGRESLDEWLGHLPIGLHAEHGFWKRLGHERGWTPRFDDHPRPWMRRAREILSSAVTTVSGSFVEEKTASLAWHYRNSDGQLAGRAAAILRESLTVACAGDDVELLEGVFVLELRERRVHKGHVVRERLGDGDGDDEALVIAIGDDLTDEDMFAALPTSGLAIAAGARARSPSHRLHGPAAVRALLERLCAHPVEAGERPLVLIAEDEPRIREGLTETLRAAGFAVIASTNGADALARLKSAARLPSVLLTDLTMPIMDGLALLGAVRADPALQALPCVVMTALPFVTGVPRDVPVLRKPFKPETMIALLHQRVSGEQAARAEVAHV
jgi:trehalose-phosphatase